MVACPDLLVPHILRDRDASGIHSPRTLSTVAEVAEEGAVARACLYPKQRAGPARPPTEVGDQDAAIGLHVHADGIDPQRTPGAIAEVAEERAGARARI